MKTKNLTPRNAAPVKRENVATVSSDANVIAPSWNYDFSDKGSFWYPLAGDDAE